MKNSLSFALSRKVSLFHVWSIAFSDIIFLVPFHSPFSTWLYLPTFFSPAIFGGRGEEKRSREWGKFIETKLLFYCTFQNSLTIDNLLIMYFGEQFLMFSISELFLVLLILIFISFLRFEVLSNITYLNTLFISFYAPSGTPVMFPGWYPLSHIYFFTSSHCFVCFSNWIISNASSSNLLILLNDWVCC